MKIRYRLLTAISINNIYVVDLPDDKIGIIRLPVVVSMVKKPGTAETEDQIRIMVEKYLNNKVEIEFDGFSTMVREDDKVLHPFNGKILTVQKCNDLLVEINETI